jgi:hypothetical protein
MPALLLPVAILEEIAQVRVLEARVVFESVAREAIEPDVAKPDDANREHKNVVVMPPAKNGERRQQVGVTGVVEKGPDRGVAKVAEHEYVWHEQQQGIDPPMLVRDAKEKDRRDKKNSAVKT